MTLNTIPLRPHTAPFRPRAARLVLGSASCFGRPDGAWWPRTRDLARELGELADVIDPLWGRLTHVAVNPRHWQPVPRRGVVVNGHEVAVDRFAEVLNPHRILLQSYTAGRWDLLVVPPPTSASSAARLMAAVA
ncbi:hypothetical protein GCM10010095_15820 [Streptomyces anthocyanicus]|uniref:DUF5994 family protein n=1 Tax=Streptomyces anthocyanicus TaxID=68174 RepID=UPI00166FE932|nr:DUF5994 family protein [Streptomyces anthocyanicus]GGL31485.1 hypothetical protein GCM10010095_15820 [Streptomyces anthocyanicus]